MKEWNYESWVFILFLILKMFFLAEMYGDIILHFRKDFTD